MKTQLVEILLAFANKARGSSGLGAPALPAQPCPRSWELGLTLHPDGCPHPASNPTLQPPVNNK